MYALLKSLLFRLDPETAHNMTVAGLRRLTGHPGLLRAMDALFTVEDPRLHVRVKTLECRNPVGLAAGFDKAAELADVLPHLGFGFIETGTFTPLLQEGRDKPRLFRYPSHEAVVNRMGFNNPGVITAAERLAEGAPRRLATVPVGANIGKGKATPPEEAVEDYATAFRHVLPVGDYFVLNVSSPNTPNLRNLQEVASLKVILERLTAMNRAWAEENAKPAKWIFTKVAPDCHPDQLDEIAHLAMETGTGLVATNTTIDHSALGALAGESGGLSGRPLTERSTDVIRRLYGVTRGVVPIIGVGGVFSAEDAYAKIRAGANLVQIYTGWIYRGPGLVPAINRGLLRLLERDGFKNVMEAVGTAAKAALVALALTAAAIPAQAVDIREPVSLRVSAPEGRIALPRPGEPQPVMTIEASVCNLMPYKQVVGWAAAPETQWGAEDPMVDVRTSGPAGACRAVEIAPNECATAAVPVVFTGDFATTIEFQMSFRPCPPPGKLTDPVVPAARYLSPAVTVTLEEK